MTQIDEKWELFNAEYALPNSMVDIGEVYHWAHYWHDKANAPRTITREELEKAAEVEFRTALNYQHTNPIAENWHKDSRIKALQAALATLGITVEGV